MLATIALCVATTAIIREGKGRYAWITLAPLSWLVAVTLTAGVQKIFSTLPNIGFLAHAAALRAELVAPGVSAARAGEIARLIWNDRVDAALTAVFIAIVIVILLDSIRVWTKLLLSTRPAIAGAEEAAA
jgi:carbon starvation protein